MFVQVPYFARRLISVQGRESHILGKYAPPKAQIRTNRAWSARWPIRPIEMQRSWNIARRVDVGLACVDIQPSPKMDVLVITSGVTHQRQEHERI